ncbi:hypothetical protein G7054_g4302 [Neopestalotiopsis clavispora]|nr:hypothetical protein G7054_g4302 [Neopestalotiopsis clavispora]
MLGADHTCRTLVLMLLGTYQVSAVSLDIPSAPDANRQCIDPSYQAFSIEFFSFLDYTGNSSYSNELNTNLINNIIDIGGSHVEMRIGGSSGNLLHWTPDLDVGMLPTFPSGTDKPNYVKVGPKLMEGFAVWPNTTKYIFGMDFNFSGYDNLIETDLKIAPLVSETLGDQLESFEIGNEFGHGFDDGVPEYVALWLDYARNVSKAVWGVEDAINFWVGGFQEPTCFEVNSTCYTVQSILEQGIKDSGLAKTASTHAYMGSAGSSWVDSQFLMNHNNTEGKVDLEAPLADYTTSIGVPYVMGETNSLSGHGKSGVSDTFGAALWAVDYVLYAATTNITKLYFHQGTGWKYSAWTPVEAFGYPAGVQGTYFSWLFTAKALRGGHKQVELLYSNKTFVAYGIYKNGCSSSEASLESIVAINLQAWKAGQDPATRPVTYVDIPEDLNATSAKVRRLTAPGANVKWGITFDSQGVDTDGTLNGTAKSEKISDARVGVAASEAVLITF